MALVAILTDSVECSKEEGNSSSFGTPIFRRSEEEGTTSEQRAEPEISRPCLD